MKPPTGLIPWFSKLREILTLHFAASPSPLRGKPTQDQDVARRISGAVAGESTQKSTYQVPITIPHLSHYIICHLPLVFLSPTSPLPFYSPSFYVRLLFACFSCHRVSSWLVLLSLLVLPIMKFSILNKGREKI